MSSIRKMKNVIILSDCYLDVYTRELLLLATEGGEIQKASMALISPAPFARNGATHDILRSKHPSEDPHEIREAS